MRARPIVAIDGPAGAGKSTLARKLAERLGFTLVDTGALYRSVALAASRAGIDFSDEDGVTAVALGLVRQRELVLGRGPSGQVKVWLRGDDISEEIRSAAISMGASKVSAIPGVRAALLDLQRQAGENGGVVLEGRDIGTVVFPDAEVKFFLTATPEERAMRRFNELRQKGHDVTYEQTLAEVVQRDRQDSERAVAPLRKADDAIVVDSSGRTIDEVLEEMVGHVEAAMRKAATT